MNELESNLRDMISERYGSLKKFTDKIDMPWTTLNSILNRGVANSNISNVLKITKELGIDAERLVDGEICNSSDILNDQPITIAAHFDGEEYTEEELNKINEFAAFVKASRK